MKGDAICQRSFKETMPKRDSLRMNAFCARLPICTIKTAIHRKTSPIWSLVPGRPSVKPCRKPGVVRISIVPDLRTGYLRNLSREVRVQLGLEDLILVAGRNLDAIASEDRLDDVVTEIASAAAEYLDQLLTDEDILAVSGGKTFMRNLVRYIKPTKLLPQLQVVATIGFVESRTSYGDANLIAFDLAEAYGASHVWFPSPAFLPDKEQVQSTRKLPIIKEGYNLMNQ